MDTPGVFVRRWKFSVWCSLCWEMCISTVRRYLLKSTCKMGSVGSKLQTGGSQYETPDLAVIAAAQRRRASSPVLKRPSCITSPCLNSKEMSPSIRMDDVEIHCGTILLPKAEVHAKAKAPSSQRESSVVLPMSALVLDPCSEMTGHLYHDKHTFLATTHSGEYLRHEYAGAWQAPKAAQSAADGPFWGWQVVHESDHLQQLCGEGCQEAWCYHRRRAQ
jgi:hypothetical protein